MNPLIDRMRRQQTEQIALQGLPFLTGRILKDQVFFPGVLHAIEHGLRRSTQGWMPLRLRGGPAVLIEKSTDERWLKLVATEDCIVDLLVW